MNTTTTSNGSPIVAVGTRVIIREVYAGRGVEEREKLTDQVGVVDNSPDIDQDIRVSRIGGDLAWDGYTYTYARRWEVAEPVEPADPADPADTAVVGGAYTSPVTQSERCLTHSRDGQTWRCSRPAGHTGQHVAAVSHDGEVVGVWPNTTQPTDQPGASIEGAEKVTASEPADPGSEAAETRARTQYEALAGAAIKLAQSEDWCHEFEEVMTNAGFGEVHCNRDRDYTLQIEFTYTLSAIALAHAIHTAMGRAEDDATPEVDDDQEIRAEAHIPWTGTDPEETLESDELRALLDNDGYEGYDHYSVSLYHAVDDGPADTSGEPGFHAEQGAASTWAQRLTDFQALIASEARSRSWGHHLGEVYEAAGVPMPRAEKLTVQVTARKTVYRHGSDVYSRALATDTDTVGAGSPDYLVLHKTLRFEIDNPADVDDTDCHCGDRDASYVTGLPTKLPEAIGRAVINGSRATLRDLMGDGSGAWTANHDDVTIECMYCAS